MHSISLTTLWLHSCGLLRHRYHTQTIAFLASGTYGRSEAKDAFSRLIVVAASLRLPFRCSSLDAAPHSVAVPGTLAIARDSTKEKHSGQKIIVDKQQ